MLGQLRNPDGTKRRRRSEQPVYSQRRKRRLLFIIIAVVLVLLIGGWYTIGFFQRLRLEGDTFRQGLNRRISTALNCQVEFTRVHDGGDHSLAATEATFITRGHDLVESGSFQQISAALSTASWFSNEWSIGMVNIGSGTIKLNTARVTLDSQKMLPPAEVRSSGGGFRFSINPEPDVITLSSLRFAGGLDLEWPGLTEKEPESIRRLIGGPKVSADGGMEGTFINATMNLRGLPALTVESVSWKLHGRRLEITGGHLNAGPGTRMEISGQADIVNDGSVSLNVSFLETQIKSLLPAAWMERVSGSLTATDCKFQAGFGKGPERSMSGDFTVTGAVFNGMGFLSKLVYFLQRQDLSILEFPSLSGHFEWSPSGGLTLTNLSAERDTFLRLGGTVTVTPSGDIKGRLKISTTELALRGRNSQVPHPFRASEEGWAAMEFNLSGTAASVADDIPVPDLKKSVPGLPGSAPKAQRGADRNEETERKFNELLPK